MNKNLIIGGVLILLIAGGVVYRLVLSPKIVVTVGTGVVKNFTITVKKSQWEFSPSTIEVQKGDTVKLELINEDSFDHGFALDAFGVSQRLPAGTTMNVEFTVTEEGEYPFYCNLPCGEGEVDGNQRGHFDMEGVIKVKP